MSSGNVSRRGVLVGAGVVGFGALVVGAGRAGAAARREYNVGTASAAAERAARDAADRVVRVLDWGDDEKTVTAVFADEAADALRNRPGVRYVELNGEMHAISVDSGDAEVPWGVDRVDAEKVHDDGETGDGADVSIIDTGIDSNHPDLETNLGTGVAFVSARGPYAEEWDDDNGHGTHCAGVADAVDDDDGVVGVSTAATLHAVKVLDKNGSGSYSDVAAGIEWVADRGHDVGSLSLGGSKSSTIEDACQYANDAGVLLVAAAGNDGSDVEDTAPATYETVVAVSATDENDEFASFSNYGDDVELAAPGVDVYSTYAGGGYETLSGTSMACPHVSGAGGQLMANGYGHTDARTRLADTAEDIGLSSSEQGAGLLDVEAAVSGSSDSAPSVSWVTPSDGATVSGTVTVQIDASDAEDADDSLDVTYSVDGGSPRSTTYDSTSGYYEDSWDTTGVSDGDHALEATATDSAGNASSSSITVTTDNTESAPTVDDLSLSEVETSDSDAEFDASWSVSDADGDLDVVDLVLTQNSDGSTEDSATVDVGGDSASGTTRLVAAGDDGSGNGYTVELTVTDADGNTASDTDSATESEDTSGDDAPTVDGLSLSEDNGGGSPHAEFDASWSVSDADGDLDVVDLTLTDTDTGTAEDSASVDVSGSDANGTTGLKAKFDENNGHTYEAELVVTDANGNTATGAATEVEDGS